jgi:hypothetical protein
MYGIRKQGKLVRGLSYKSTILAPLYEYAFASEAMLEKIPSRTLVKCEMVKGT